MGKIVHKDDRVQVEMSLDEMLLKRPVLSRDGTEGPYFSELMAAAAWKILFEIRPDLMPQSNGVKVEGKGKVVVTFLKEQNLKEYANGRSGN